MENEDADLRKQVNEIYTPLSVAKEEIWRRWNDKKLRKKVEDFLGGDIPEVFKKEPRAVISKHIISPNIELGYFLSLAKEIKLKPLGLEGVIDKFCTTNPDKAALGKMTFIEKDAGNKKNTKKEYYKIINIKKYEGEKFYKIKTLWGERLVDFHHRILNNFYPDLERFDDFLWFKKKGLSIKPVTYYKNCLAFFLCFGVLFENFYLNKNEINFTKNIIILNFLEIERIFGIRPLIVALETMEDEADLFWKCYQYSFKEDIKSQIKN